MINQKKSKQEKKQRQTSVFEILDRDYGDIPVDSTLADSQQIMFMHTLWERMMMSASLPHFTEDMTHENTHTHTYAQTLYSTFYLGKRDVGVCLC